MRLYLRFIFYERGNASHQVGIERVRAGAAAGVGAVGAVAGGRGHVLSGRLFCLFVY